MKNEAKRNKYAISAQFRKAGSHKDLKRDKAATRLQVKEGCSAAGQDRGAQIKRSLCARDPRKRNENSDRMVSVYQKKKPSVKMAHEEKLELSPK